MNIDRPAEVDFLLEKIENAYCNTLGHSGYDDGLPERMASEIITRSALMALLEAGITDRQSMQKVLQFLPLHSEYLEG